MISDTVLIQIKKVIIFGTFNISVTNITHFAYTYVVSDKGHGEKPAMYN